MSILSRYILRQHIGPFFFSFSIISLIWILNLLFKELNRFLSKGLPIHLIIEFFVLSLGWIVALSVPMATLTASLMVYGRMSGDNEITAMKATGVSFLRILRPTLFASILLAMGLVWFNNNVLPHSNHRLSMLMRYMANKKPAMRIEPGVWFDDLTNISMLVADKVDSGNVSIVREVMINDYSDLHAISTINADSGRIWANEKTGILEIRLFKGEIQSISLNSMKEFKRLQFQDYLIRINVADMFNQQRPDSKRRSDREMSAQEMLAEVHENEKKYAAKKQHIQELVGREFNKLFGTSFGLPMPATNDSLEILSDDAGEPAKVKAPPHFIKYPEQLNLPPRKIIEIPPIKKAYLNQKEVLTSLRVDMNGMQSYKRRNDKLMVEVHKKYSIPFACIIFVLVGMSLGTMSRSGGIGMSLGISLFFFILHWALIIAGEDLADRGLVSPFLSMWLANIIVGVASLVLLYLLTNETPVSEFIKHNWLKFLGIGFLVEWIQKKYLQRNDFAAM